MIYGSSSNEVKADFHITVALVTKAGNVLAEAARVVNINK